MYEGKLLDRYDARVELGYPVFVENGAIQYEDQSVELPERVALSATVAVARALLPVQLCGKELKFLRKALRLTGEQLSDAIDAGGASVVSRWESDKTAMSGYVEKVIRQLVVDELRDRAPGVEIPKAAISRMKIRARQDEGRDPLPLTVVYQAAAEESQVGAYAIAA